MLFAKQTKKQSLVLLAHSIACMNGVISSLESIGFNIDDKTCNGCLYESFSGVCSVAMQDLEFPSVTEENETYNQLIEVTLENYEEVVSNIWEKYGVEQYE